MPLYLIYVVFITRWTAELILLILRRFYICNIPSGSKSSPDLPPADYVACLLEFLKSLCHFCLLTSHEARGDGILASKSAEGVRSDGTGVSGKATAGGFSLMKVLTVLFIIKRSITSPELYNT